MRIRNLLGLAGLLPAAAIAQPGGPPVEYVATFENAVHHEARISVTYRDIGAAPLELRMSRSSPGRYAIHEFAKNVYDVSAVDGAGRALKVTRNDPYSWIVAGHDGTVTATYTLYADRGDGTYSQIDLTHAHLNMPATFMWAKGFDDRPISVAFRPADPKWRAATQLQPTRGRMTFRAPNLQYFMDSPTELSDFELREWQVQDGDKRPTIRLVVHHQGTDADVDLYAEKAKKVVAEQIKIYGDVPDFDYGEYTFITDSLPHVSGDGMEHRNSTIITDVEGLYESEFDQLGTLSHEFFHIWNVERVRPAELEPFDFTRANPSPSLWMAEGFTTYFGNRSVRRAGESSVDDFSAFVSALLNTVVRGNGRKFASPQEMSRRAPFSDAATSIDPNNHSNVFISYYPYGATVALALDLTLRRRFPGISLDDYMRLMWRKHGLEERPYTPDDQKAALAEVTGDKAFADEFFARSIEGSELPDFAPLLEQAGLKVRLKNQGNASLGSAQFAEDGESAVLAGATLIGTPLYEAGLDGGDEIVSIGRFKIDDLEDYERALSRHKPGDNTTIRFIQRGLERSATIAFVEDGTLEVVRFEAADLTPSPAQLAFRRAWLGEESEGSGD